MSPLVILVIGVVVVIGMILVLRVNAFVALITAAMLVSLLSPGRVEEKIARVAEAFGSVCGSIGIVIALAAVIGKCLMDSGAADRIVRSFLRALGEKRAASALMASGFVLSVPVFFDTVFYLLVPLARSLYGRTKKNYLLYVTAIGAGGALTHTLVPPTPGPLFMAKELGVDLGVMILVGLLIAAPTAIVGLLICQIMNRWMDIPMRAYADEPERESLDDSQLPPLILSLLPVVLPVILISANTFAKALEAPANLFSVESPTQADVGKLDNLEVPAALDEFEDNNRPLSQNALVEVIKAGSEWRIQDAAGTYVVKNQNGTLNIYESPWLSQITAVLGNPNLALLFSAAIAMWLLLGYRKMTLAQLGDGMDKALMSGGVIILITAGGGAFGAMLRAAGIQQAVEEFVGKESQIGGVTILLVAGAVASVVKFAQGSGTVAMITTTSIFAAMGLSSESLGFHPVYLATAIGGGSLVGDWMNNSGFWIFARMSGLTEIETLKTWTVLTGLLGITALGFTLLASQIYPMV